MIVEEIEKAEPSMNHLDVGLDKGFSKTNLAVVDSEGHVLLETRIEHFDGASEQSLTHEHVLQQIAHHLIPFKASPLHCFGHVGTTQGFFGGLRSHGLHVQSLEAFNDTHLHYGLSDMPGNAITVACGSYWNAMYYDDANNVHCFAGDIWQEIPWSFSGIAFARFLLAWWQGTDCPSPFRDDIVACTGLSAQQLQDRIDPALSLDALYPARWLALGPLVSRYADEERVSTFLSQGTSELRHLYDRFCAQVQPPNAPMLVLGGSIWSRPIFERVQAQLEAQGIPVVQSQGNPAWGAIRFRRAHPHVQLEPWARHLTRECSGDPRA